ncbi:MAG: hypothetical protein M5T52_12835 [Ignavibacteriaceae bacterium]|nr:hypothetical protein [Ignavibacteriaceae bacterium]
MSKLSLLTTHYSLLTFTFYLLLLSFSVSAQVIIKERVEINPQTINPEYQISQFDPCPNITRPQYHQSVYSYSGFPVEPYQQLYPFQSGTDSTKLISTALYNAEIITGTDYAYFERIEYIDSSGNTYPSETFGSLLTGLTGAELSGTGNYIGIEHTGTFERENSTVYRIKFNNYSEPEATVIVRITNLNTNTYTDWHTLIVNPDLRLVNQQYEADTLLHYYSKDVTPRLVNANYPCNHPGFGGCPPENVTFNIEIIEGQQYGRIKNELTEELSTSFTGIAFSELYLFTYYANGNQPDSTATVRIRHSSNDAEITPMEFSFTIKRNTIPPPSEGGSIYVKMNKKVVAPGDTVNVQLRWVDEVGDTIDFLPIQRFRVGLAEGSQYGRILDIQTGDTADTFTEIGNEFKVISSAEIEPSQVKIILVAEADLMIFTRPVRINNGTMKTKKLEENTVDKNDEQGGTNTDLIIIGNHLVGVGEITITKTPFVVEIIPSRVSPGDTAQIIPMKLNPDGTTSPFDSLQTFELGMIEGCDAGLILNNGAMENYFAEVYQPIYFVAANDLTETDTVMVRVGLIEGGGSSRPVNTGGEKTDAIITNLNKNKKEPELLPMNPSTYCFPENFWTPHDLEGIANLVVGDECDNLPTEQQEISYTLLEQPEFFIVPHSDLEELKLVELIQVCNDTAHPNQNGGSIPVEYKRYRYDYTTNSFKISWVLEPYKGIDG